MLYDTFLNVNFIFLCVLVQTAMVEIITKDTSVERLLVIYMCQFYSTIKLAKPTKSDVLSFS